MSTHNTALTQYIEAKGTQFAYRLFGLSGGVPLVCVQHFRGTMDHWDPLLIDALAKVRPILLLDDSGVGKSSGTVPEDFAEMATNVAAVCDALSLKKIDVLGFSIGSYVAQFLALDNPQLVRRAIFAGGMPSGGPGIETGDTALVADLISASTPEDTESIFLRSFFSPGEEKQSLGRAWWKRMNERTLDRSNYLGEEGTQRQLAALTKWLSTDGKWPSTYNRLENLTIPVFVAGGAKDRLVPATNSVLLAKLLPNAHLHIYPDAGHGFLNEYATLFAAHINLFLE